MLTTLSRSSSHNKAALAPTAVRSRLVLRPLASSSTAAEPETAASRETAASAAAAATSPPVPAAAQPAHGARSNISARVRRHSEASAVTGMKHCVICTNEIVVDYKVCARAWGEGAVQLLCHPCAAVEISFSLSPPPPHLSLSLPSPTHFKHRTSSFSHSSSAPTDKFLAAPPQARPPPFSFHFATPHPLPLPSPHQDCAPSSSAAWPRPSSGRGTLACSAMCTSTSNFSTIHPCTEPDTQLTQGLTGHIVMQDKDPPPPITTNTYALKE